jgi:hypothetical protein
MSNPSAFGRVAAGLKDFFALPDLDSNMSNEKPHVDLIIFPPRRKTGVVPPPKEKSFFGAVPLDDGDDPALRLNFTMSSDLSIGGASTHSLVSKPNTQPQTAPTVTHPNPNPQQFLQWSGNLTSAKSSAKKNQEFEEKNHYKMNTPELKAERTGFVSIRSPNLNPGATDFMGDGAFINLDDYLGLEVTVRFNHDDVENDNNGDSKPKRQWNPRTNYMLNLYVDSFIPGDLYQGYILPPPIPEGDQSSSSGWITFSLPFHAFILTSEGRVREVQRPLDGMIRLKHIGITAVTEFEGKGAGGDFRIDFGGIRAVTNLEEQSTWRPRRTLSDELR